MFPAGAAFSNIDITIICSTLLRGCMPAGRESLFPLVCFACSAVLGTLQVLHMCMNRCVSGHKEITLQNTGPTICRVCACVWKRDPILWCERSVNYLACKMCHLVVCKIGDIQRKVRVCTCTFCHHLKWYHPHWVLRPRHCCLYSTIYLK